MPRVRRPPLLVLIVGAALLLLPVLAALQYQWLGQLSRAERDRMQRSVHRATERVAQEIDLELVRALIGLQLDTDTVRTEAWDRYSDRYDVWSAAAVVPGLVESVLLVDTDRTGELRVRRWDDGRQAFVPSVWTPELGPIRERAAAKLSDWNKAPSFDSLRVEDLLVADGSAILAPAIPLPRSAPAAGPLPVPASPAAFSIPEPLFAWGVIRLDRKVLRAELLPAVIARHFGRSAEPDDPQGGDYRVAIVSRARPTEVVFQSEPGVAADLVKSPDASIDLFGLRPDQFTLVRQAAGSLRPPAGSPAQPRRGTVFGFFARRSPGNEGQARETRDLLRWRLVAQHRAGSLDAAVASVRRRNLGISFGIMLLMAGALAILAATARRAERLAYQQMEFVAGVSHELRTPVTVIAGAATNLADGVVTDQARVKQYGTTIQAEARRLGETVERVLQFAGIESGRMAMHLATISPAALVDEAIAASAAAIAEAGMRIETDVPADLPLVRVDPTALRSCLQNLIGNAVKYRGASHSLAIRVTAGAGRRGAQEVRFAVEDHGVGIQPRDLPHVFEPFYRGREAVERRIHGNGLGLAVVKRMVEAHGGRVTVTSAPGRGSTFTLHVPVSQGEPAPHAVGERASSTV